MTDLLKQITKSAESLTEREQRTLLKYIRGLQERSGSDQGSQDTGSNMVDPDDDPILEMIGTIDEDLGADQIDEQLYGTDRVEENSSEPGA